jgi:urease accessory protein
MIMITRMITRTPTIMGTITVIITITIMPATTMIMTIGTIMTRKTRGARSAESATLRAKTRKPSPPKPIVSRPRSTEDVASLFRLMTWLSPSFPVGAFSYSSGLEWAVESGDVTNASTLQDWLGCMLADGAGFCDAVFLAHAHRAAGAADDSPLAAVTELAAAFVPTRERHLETTSQGRAFIEIARETWPCDALQRLLALRPGAIAYPVAVGVVSAGHRVPLEAALPAFLHAQTANWISAGVRLIPLGQTDGQRVLAALEPIVHTTADRALHASLGDLGSTTFRADIASMRHEAQYTRLFRS